MFNFIWLLRNATFGRDSCSLPTLSRNSYCFISIFPFELELDVLVMSRKYSEKPWSMMAKVNFKSQSLESSFGFHITVQLQLLKQGCRLDVGGII